MVQPGSSSVIPRVLAPESGAALALEDLVGPYLEEDVPGAVAVLGDKGAGKTVAHSLLRARWPEAGLLDEPEAAEVRRLAADKTVVYFSVEPLEVTHLARFSLAPWSQDELLEYLLATHRERCGSVMARLSRADLGRTGCPEIWSSVLDSMARDPSIRDLPGALCAEYAGCMRRAGLAALCCTPHGSLGWRAWSHLGSAPLDERSLSLFRHRLVQVILAAREIVRRLGAGRSCRFLVNAPPREVIDTAGPLLARSPAALEQLAEQAVVPSRQAAAASLLHAAGVHWRPPENAELTGALLAGIGWRKVDLTGAELTDTDLSRADLTEATLDGAHARGINLNRARMHGASLRGLQASHADLSGADLSHVRGCVCFRSADLAGANLRGALLHGTDFSDARLVGADFTRADLSGSKLAGADLAGANLAGACLERAILAAVSLRGVTLSGASFERAWLRGARLGGVHFPGAALSGAHLMNADLTGAHMPDARLSGASLHGARCAEVCWERADLRKADLRRIDFHMGSSRSGLIFSPIACEGSRTGFYTDDYDEMHFKAPEEIRKANLFGADLREARVEETDFYLVDLRQARYDADQERHFRRCGAILGTRV